MIGGINFMPKSVNIAFSEFLNNTVNISKEDSDNAKKAEIFYWGKYKI